jgi:TPP-dependent pyruvate/acetoin dehydrogenase alpha subunit
VFSVASKYIERARKGEGPAFLQFKTYRYHGHHVGDVARAYYRPKSEEQEWVTQRDPITLHGEWLMANGVADRAALDAIQESLITGHGRGGGVRGQRAVPRSRQGRPGYLCLIQQRPYAN